MPNISLTQTNKESEMLLQVEREVIERAVIEKLEQELGYFDSMDYENTECKGRACGNKSCHLDIIECEVDGIRDMGYYN